MSVAKERELQENLEFLRGQFDALNQDIKLPHSLQPDRMRYQLEHLDLREEKPRRYWYWRAFVGVAACFVVVLGSVRGINSMEKSSAALSGEQMPSQEERIIMPSGAAVAFPEDTVPELAAGGLEAAPEAQAFEMEDDTEDDTAALEKSAIVTNEAPVSVGRSLEEPDAALDSQGIEPMMEQSPEAESDKGGRAPRMVSSDYRSLESLEQAHEQLPWGNWLPKSAPAATAYSNGGIDSYALSICFLNQDYTKELRVSVQDYTEEMSAWFADPEKPETYDLRLYEIPYAESIPEEYFYTTQNSLFRAEEVTRQILEARLIPSDEPGDEKQYYGNLSVLYQDGFVVEYSSVNVSPEELYQIITETMATAQTASPVGG